MSSSSSVPGSARHVVVIGAGAVGAACALQARRAGWQVTLLNPQPAGDAQAASYGNAGWLSSHSIIPPAGPGLLGQLPGMLLDRRGALALRWRYLPRALPWLWRYVQSGRSASRVARSAHALRALLRDAPALHLAQAASAGVADLIVQQGLLHVYRNADDYAADALGWQIRQREGITLELLDASALREQEPDLDPSYQFGVRVAEAGHCRNPGAYVAALVAQAEREGAQLRLGTATGLTLHDGRLQAVQTAHGPIACQAAVLAAGAWSGALARQVGDRVCLDTERGYHVMLQTPPLSQAAGRPAPIGPRSPTMVMDRKLIVHQMAHGLRIAGQVEIAGLHAEADWRRADILREHLYALYPSLPRAALASGELNWMGRRPSTPDGLPCIGVSSASRDVIHAYGHGHVGLGASARTARLVAQLLCGLRPEIELAPFSPQRWQAARERP